MRLPYIGSWQILLQNSAAADRSSAISLRTAALDPPALTLFTQLQRQEMRSARSGGGRATSDASRRRFWAIVARKNSS